MSDYPAIPEPGQNLDSAVRSIRALKQAVELLTGARGDGSKRAYTAAEAGAALQPYQPPSYQRSELPSPAAFPRAVVYIANPVGTINLAFSDGAAWRYADGTAV